MSRHFASKFLILGTPDKGAPQLYISSLQMYCVHKWQNKGNPDKNRVFKAISIDKQHLPRLNTGNAGHLRPADSGKNPLNLGEPPPPAVLPGCGGKRVDAKTPPPTG